MDRERNGIEAAGRKNRNTREMRRKVMPGEGEMGVNNDGVKGEQMRRRGERERRRCKKRKKTKEG